MQRCVQRVFNALDDKLISASLRVLGFSDSSSECTMAWHRGNFGERVAHQFWFPVYWNRLFILLNILFSGAPTTAAQSYSWCASTITWSWHSSCRNVVSNSLVWNPGGSWCHDSVDLKLAGEDNVLSKLEQQLPCCLFLQEDLWVVLTVGSSQRLMLWSSA